MLFPLILACGVGFINGQCADRLTDSACISIEKCETLRPLVIKHNKTPAELNYLRKQTCGFDGTLPRICCPNNLDCQTPEGANGQCVDIRNCSYFVELLKCNPTPHDIAFVERSRCFGPDGYSVCCTNSPPLVPIPPIDQRDAMSDQCPAAALPPRKETGCCGPHEGLNKISGGVAANVDQFPWLVLIEYRRNNSKTIFTNCGGALISGKYVLTAAHCVYAGKLYILTSVRLGEYDTTNSGPDCVEVEGDADGRDCTYGAVSIPVERIIRHPNYHGDPDFWNDIALLRLARMATYNYFVRPVCLPSSNISAISPGLRLFAAGWGAVNQSINASPVKQVVDLPLVDILTCSHNFLNFTHPPRLWNGQMCAGGEPGKDACTGDSGGPLMKLTEDQYEVVGIVSYGTKPCGRLPGVYTNVHAYLDWIRSHIHK